MRKYLALTAVLASLLSATASNASILGEKVYARIGLGNGSPSVDTNALVMNAWGGRIVGAGLEFRSVSDRNVQKTNFNGRTLIVSDIIMRNANINGWQMKFRLPASDAFDSITLLNSSFTSGLTYSVSPKGVLTISFAGTSPSQFSALAERGDTGRQTFLAKFSFTNEGISSDPVSVPEPGTWAMLTAGLFSLMALGWSRRKPTLKKIRSA